MTSLRLIVFFLLSIPAIVLRAQDNHSILNEETAITFNIKNFGLKVEGSFSRLDGNIIFDEYRPTSSSFDVRLPANSINTNNKARDKHLRSEDYFEVDKYPFIIFKSNTIVKSENKYEVKGKLTIKNTTKDVSIPFTYKNVEGVSEFTGQLKLDRRDYGVGKSSWVLSDEVNIQLKVITK